jgi:hypothetical protein
MKISDAKDLLMIGVVGVGVYYVWKIFAGPEKTLSCLLAKATKAVGQAVCSAETALASCVVNWTTCSAISLNGNVVFPNGTQVAVNALPVGTDSDGNVYVQYSGGVYQLSASNSCGNYQATLTG